MTMTASTESVVCGGGDDLRWSQTLILTNLFIAAEAWGEQAAQKGMAFLKEIEARYAVAPPTQLESFKSLISDCAAGKTSLSFAVALVVGKILYVYVGEGGCAWIVRQDKHAVLIQNTGTVSGVIRPDDVICLGSSSFAQFIARNTLFKYLSLKEPSRIAQGIIAFLHEREVVPVVSGIALRFFSETQNSKLPRFRIPLVNLRPFAVYFVQQFWHISAVIRRKPLVSVICLVAFLLSVSIVGGVRTKQVEKRTRVAETVLSEVEHQYDEGIALIDYNPVRARELLAQAQTTLEKEIVREQDAQLKEKLENKLNQVQQGIAIALRSYTVTPDIFYELNLIKSGGEGQNLALYQDSLSILDSKNKLLYRLSINTKASRIIAAGEALATATGIAAHGEDVFVYSTDVKKVVVAGNTLETIIPHEAEWGNITAIAAYGGNMYLLDTSLQQIWKYIGTERGFGTRQDYLLFDTKVDLTDAANLAIDGSVWLTGKGAIRRFTQGREDVWSIKGLDEPLGSKLDIYTDDTTKNLYIFDKIANRVVVCDKGGVYLAQYRWQKDEEIRDFVVSEVIRKILLLTRDTIYAIDIK